MEKKHLLLLTFSVSAYFPTLNLCFVIEQSPEHRACELEVYAVVNNLVSSTPPDLS